MNAMLFDQAGAPPLLDIRALWTTVWRRRLLVAAVAIGVVAAAFGYLAITRPSYVATASILVDPRDVRSTNIDSVLPGIGADSAAIASQVSIIQSRDLLGSVFDALGLDSDPEYAGAGLTRDGMVQKFLGAVGVEREGLTYVINVSVKSADPEKAARIANAIVERYIAGTTAQQANATSDVNAALNARIEALQADVSAAERAVEDFRQKNGIFDETTGGTLQSQIDQLSAQIIVAQDTLNQAQARYEQAAAAGTSPQAMARLSDITASATADQLRDSYNQSAAALASAEATYGPKHPNVIQARAELGKVADLLSREAARIRRELQSARDLAQDSLARLQQSLDALRERSGAAGVAQVELRRLQGRADAARVVLADFLQRSQETSQMEGLQSSQVHVISRAAAPVEAAWPKPKLILPVAAMLGVMLGCGAALALGVPVPAPLPAPTPAPTEPTRPRRVAPAPAAPIAAKPRPVSPARRLASLEALRDEMSGAHDTAVTAAVQALLRDILAALPAHGRPYVLAVSALRDAELARAGLTLAALGLERIGARVLALAPGSDPGPLGGYQFVLVEALDELAGAADLEILVLAPDEGAPFAGRPDRIDFVLPEAALSSAEPRPTRAAS
jgi:uncharacterized protein involved in exopolysaccharide biosynthesis